MCSPLTYNLLHATLLTGLPRANPPPRRRCPSLTTSPLGQPPSPLSAQSSILEPYLFLSPQGQALTPSWRLYL